ncbi:MAG: hypothetical protein EOO54_17720 [Haliea sp.]|nr:MAG: hypothetical protein EOO54_17720 [Haliea sp.]
MRTTYFRILCCSVALASLSGCDLPFWPEPPPVLSKEAVATRDAPPERVFRGTLAGKAAFLIVNDCEVFDVQRGAGEEVTWTSVLKPEFYPFFTFCERQSMTVEADAIVVTLGRMAFGAGGCCATGGTYRTTDGRTWKKI